MVSDICRESLLLDDFTHIRESGQGMDETESKQYINMYYVKLLDTSYNELKGHYIN